ncbi:hypothetical protein VP01_10223g1, partial [Puccinia sorghi]
TLHQFSRLLLEKRILWNSKLIVGDTDKRILYYLTEWPGCSHDSRLWDNCNLNLEINQFFSPGQYLIADSGFPTEKTLNMFNQHLASLCVCNKHCIGILKGHFQSLQGLRLELPSVEIMKRITQWIGACVVLHNFPLNDDSSN